eukprot:TRINITY_DN20927_c0_g1_i1.p1 TRINITY_DN20927_c0_g1~~TRINITY_DN20927_c0_g1_i1.p1  ORF type:complete len:597 (+),score=169.06 TRINITY_DN20927_c0_g1_i1:43-1833(+)
MPGSHAPTERWATVGIEVTVRSKRGTCETGTVVSVDLDERQVMVALKRGGLETVGFDVVWRIDKPLPVLPQVQNPLYVDWVALHQSGQTGRLRQQYGRMSPEEKKALLDQGVFPSADEADTYVTLQGVVEDLPSDPVPVAAAHRQIVRCPCGWNDIVSPMMVPCASCSCLVHCVCVGIRHPDDLTRRGKRFLCVFCELRWPRPVTILPAPPLSPEGLPYRVPTRMLLQRFPPLAPIPPAVAEMFEAMKARLRKLVASKGYTIEEIHGGRYGVLDSSQMVATCASVCASAVREGIFNAAYPDTIFKNLRRDATARVLLVRDAAGQAPAAVLASSAAECPLRLTEALGALRCALDQPDPSLYLDMSDRTALARIAAEVAAPEQLPHLIIVATAAEHRKRGLASALMLYDLLAWATAGRRQAYLNMALARTVVGGEPAFHYSAASLRLYESFGYRTVYPRPLVENPLLPDGTKTCEWMGLDIDHGIEMVNMDVWQTVVRAHNAMFPGAPAVPPAGFDAAAACGAARPPAVATPAPGASGSVGEEEYEEWEECEEEDGGFDPANYVYEGQAPDAYCGNVIRARPVVPYHRDASCQASDAN